MIVFLGWSHSGKKYAEALEKFLLTCFETGVTVQASMGLSKGSDWSDELFQKLKGTDFGVMCLTPDSDSAWLCYEAGVLASVGAPVAPLLFGVSVAFSPLAQKQATAFAKEEVRKLTDDMYRRFKLTYWDTYEACFEKAWPEFKEDVRKIEEENVYRLTNFEADLKALLAPENSGEYGMWTAKRGEALAALLKNNKVSLLSKARELQAYMDELRKYESANPLFSPLRMKLERLVL